MRSIIKSAIRIIIIFIFIRSLLSFINSIVPLLNDSRYYRTQQDILNGWGILLIAFLIGTLVLWILWWKADFLTRILTENLNDNKLVINTSNTELIKVALILLGIFLVVDSIPGIMGLIGYHIRLTSVDEGLISTPQSQADELRLWIIPVVTVLIGLALAIGIKKHWWKANGIRKENKNMISPSIPFSITKITIEGFAPEKSYSVFAISLDQYSAKDTGHEETESPESQEIAFFLVGDDKGEFTWIAEDECKLASSKD